MIVLKIGGSLYNSAHLKNWLLMLADHIGRGIVIVPGGGPFADQVRLAAKQWNVPEEHAHTMAVLAMQQFGHMMIGLNSRLVLVDDIEKIKQSDNLDSILVWAPYKEVHDAIDIEKNWQTTSDSIALWLATKLSTEHLCLVKSAPIKGRSLKELIATEVVDNSFDKLVQKYSGQVHFYNAVDANKFLDQYQSGIFS